MTKIRKGNKRIHVLYLYPLEQRSHCAVLLVYVPTVTFNIREGTIDCGGILYSPYSQRHHELMSAAKELPTALHKPNSVTLESVEDF